MKIKLERLTKKEIAEVLKFINDYGVDSIDVGIAYLGREESNDKTDHFFNLNNDWGKFTIEHLHKSFVRDSELLEVARENEVPTLDLVVKALAKVLKDNVLAPVRGQIEEILNAHDFDLYPWEDFVYHLWDDKDVEKRPGALKDLFVEYTKTADFGFIDRDTEYRACALWIAEREGTPLNMKEMLINYYWSKLPGLVKDLREFLNAIEIVEEREDNNEI